MNILCKTFGHKRKWYSNLSGTFATWICVRKSCTYYQVIYDHRKDRSQVITAWINGQKTEIFNGPFSSLLKLAGKEK